MDIETLREYCLSKKGVAESFPFGEETLVFKVGTKVFALAGIDHDPPQVNLKCDPARAIELREDYPGSVIPGYHMNKKHWNTVIFDGTLSEDLEKELVDHSYELVIEGMTRKEKKSLGL